MRKFKFTTATTLLFLAFVTTGTISRVQAAACCGSSASLPSLISGDDRYQLSLSSSLGSVIGDAPVSGLPVFRSSATSDRTQIQRLDFGAILSDRLQVSASANWVTRTSQTRDRFASVTSAGDPTFGIAYEAWPEWEFTEWTPRGFLFAQLSLPLSRSVHDSQRSDGLDAVGVGFFRATIGALLVKVRGNWDYSILPELHHSFSRTFNSANEDSLFVRPGSGASLLLATGYNFATFPLRIGFRLQPSWNSGRYTEQADWTGTSSSQWVQNTGADLAWMPNSESSLNLAYTDQTLLGPAANSTLSRTLALQLQRRWPR